MSVTRRHGEVRQSFADTVSTVVSAFLAHLVVVLLLPLAIAANSADLFAQAVHDQQDDVIITNKGDQSGPRDELPSGEVRLCLATRHDVAYQQRGVRVSGSTGAIEGIVGYLHGPSSEMDKLTEALPIDEQDQAAMEIVMTAGTLSPITTVLRYGETVRFVNRGIAREIRLACPSTRLTVPFSVHVPVGRSRDVVWTGHSGIGLTVCHVSSVGDVAEAWVFAVPHAFADCSNEDGMLVLKQVPTGKRTIYYWKTCGTVGKIQSASWNGHPVDLGRGLDVTVEEGINDLGIIDVSMIELQR